MSDDQLEADLRRAFSSRELTIDPEGDAGVALRREIIGVASPARSRAVPDNTVDDVGEAPIVGVSGRQNRSGSWAWAAACLAFVATFGLGIWLAFAAPAPPVLTDSADDASVNEESMVEDTDASPQATLIAPNETPLITIVDGDGVSLDEVARCIDSPPPGEGSRGAPPLASATTFGPARGFDSVAVFADFGDICANGVSVSLSGQVLQRPLEPFDLRMEGQGEAAIAGAPDDEDFEPYAEWWLTGLAGENIVDVRVIDPRPTEQLFRRVGSTFLLNAFFANSASPERLEIEVTYSDGAQLVGVPAPFDGTMFGGGELVTFPCEDVDTCVSDRLQLLASEATEARSFEQARILRDGQLTQVEYDQAVSEFERCLASFSDERAAPPAVLVEGSPEAIDAVACFDETLHFVEQARVWHNQIEQSGPANFILPVTDPRLDPAESSTDASNEDDAPERFFDVSVPSTAGLNLGDALDALDALGIRAGELGGSQNAACPVVGTEPPAGAVVPIGSEVAIILSDCQN